MSNSMSPSRKQEISKYIDPNSKFKLLWDLTVLLATVAVTIEAPLVVVFNIPSNGFIFVFDVFITVLFAADIVLHFFTAYEEKRKLVYNGKNIAKKYMKFWFWVDLLATTPLYLIGGVKVLAINKIFRFFRMARLLKLFTSAKTLKKTREFNLNPSIVRLLLMIFWVFLAAHLITCVWIYIDGIPSAVEDSVTGEMVELENPQRYTVAFYWTITTLTTIGYGDISPNPTNTLQIVFVILMELLGAGMYGFIIGNIATLIANIDVTKSQYQEKIERVNTFMKYRNIPASLQKRVNDYYDYLWDSRRGYDETNVLSELPLSLKVRVSLYINKEIIEKVPIFKGASPSFIKEIIMNMKPVVFTPGDYIMRKGEIGDEMFFISKGRVDVVSEDETVVYATLTGGQFFGEIALLLSAPRNATIKAKDYCDLYSLDKSTFDQILIRYPAFAKNIENQADQRRKETEQNQKEKANTSSVETQNIEDGDDVAEIEALGEEDEVLVAKIQDIAFNSLSPDRVEISWGKDPYAHIYEILKKENGLWTILGQCEECYFEDTIAEETKSFYRIRGKGENSRGPWSEVFMFDPKNPEDK